MTAHASLRDPEYAMKRPNILFLMTDQHRHDGLGCANPRIRTPNLDVLAARGVRFTNAVCNVPMCVPSRYSMMTGYYGCQLGVKHNTQMFTRDDEFPVPTLPQRLCELGYQTAGFGKTHWYIGSRIMPDVAISGSKRGFGDRAIVDRSDPGNIEPGSLYQAEDEPEWHERLTAETRQGGPGGESVPGYIGQTSQIPVDHHREGWLTRHALRFLDAGRDPDRPFFLYLSFDYPHPGFYVPAGFEDLYDIDDFADNPPPQPIPAGHGGAKLEDRWCNMTSEQRRRSRLRYAALCSYVDSLFGRVLDKLRQIGQLDNTFILFTSDHGEMLGDRGRVSKYCLYEGSVRVPMILAGAGVKRCGAVDDRHAELVDVMPTLLQVAGADVPDSMPGLSLLSDRARGGSFAEMHGRGYEEYQKAPAVMYRTRDWKLIMSVPGHLGEVFGCYDAMRGELYNLRDDPLELNNLYEDARYAAVRHDLTAKLLMHVMCSLGKYPFATARTKIKVTGPVRLPDASLWPSA
jgi:arylsulfatase